MDRLPPHLVESFRTICRETYGHELSHEEAEKAGIAFLRVVVLLAKQRIEREQRGDGDIECILPE